MEEENPSHIIIMTSSVCFKHMLTHVPVRKLLVVNRKLCYNWLDRRDASCHQVSYQPSMLAGKAVENRLQDTSPETKNRE